MKTSPLTVEEIESIQEVIICDYRLIFCVSCLVSMTYILLRMMLISGTEGIQK